MSISDVIRVLGSATSLAGIAFKISSWFRSAIQTQDVDPALRAALSKLSHDASADDIVRVLQPFYLAKGGDVFVRGGDGGGGNINLMDAKIEGGSGPGGGGSVTISGGNAGSSGKGGDVTITGGVIKGGDAK